MVYNWCTRDQTTQACFLVQRPDNLERAKDSVDQTGRERLRDSPALIESLLAALIGGCGHHAGDLREDLRDAGCNARHDRAGGNGNEAGHQRVFNEILTAGVFPDTQLPDKVRETIHFALFSSPVTTSVLGSIEKLSSIFSSANQGNP